ncbi:hypothetical protein [Novosphingobium lentum]|uniref:hypothetical protein n=1 Tax=Novosphingobium lentum TaxID=145287 RepID=UPI00082A2F37|nr:hypothetical protein [Novosphingobium lentum]
MTDLRRTVLASIVALVAVLLGGPARASSDYTCSPSWRLADYAMGCGNRAMPSPGNDSRVNVVLLFARPSKSGSAAQPYPKAGWEERGFGHSFFSWPQLREASGLKVDDTTQADPPYDSRCSSLASGSAAFAAAMAANARLPAAERTLLTEARASLAETCTGDTRALRATWPDMASAPGRAFLGYLRGADAFYGGDWAGARTLFAAQIQAADPWVAETAAYMAIRIELNAAQQDSFDEYGTFLGAAKTDKAAVARAQAAIAAYLKRYPKGRYVTSARGLERRALWLAGDRAALSAAYERALGVLPVDSAEAFALVQEIDNKLLFGADAKQPITSPLLLAVHDLLEMRRIDEDATPALDAATLAAQKPLFATRPDLFTYLGAAQAFYVRKDMAAVLALTSPASTAAGTSPVTFGMAMLRGMALAALHDAGEIAQWQAMLASPHALYQRPLVELALARRLERDGRVAEVFAAGSLVTDPTIREILLYHVAGPDLLRQVARDCALDRHQRDVAAFTLLRRDLANERFADFADDRKLVAADADSSATLWNFPFDETIPVGLFVAGKWSQGFRCPPIAATAASLATNPADLSARLCLGEFWRLNAFDALAIAERGEERPDGALGTSPSLFPGHAITRASLYDGIIAQRSAPAEARAYALYRAVHCYAPSGNNDCGGTDVPIATRRAWHDALKREYPASRWARELQFYW